MSSSSTCLDAATEVIPRVMKMQVPELQKALRERGLDSKGLKAALVERLRAALDNPESAAANGSGSSGPGSAASASRQQTLPQ